MPISCSPTISLGTLEVAVTAKPTRTKRVLRAQYGDGYDETRADGLNPWSTTWQMETVPLTEDDWLTLEATLEALGEKPFYWQAPGAPVQQAWKLDPVQWQRSYIDTYATLQFTIKTWNGPPPAPIVFPPAALYDIDPDYIVRPNQSKVYPASGTMYPSPYAQGFYPAAVSNVYSLVVIGSFFTTESKVVANNVPLPTAFRNPTTLEASINAADYLANTVLQLHVQTGAQATSNLPLVVVSQ
jgi:phage-related protein